MPSFSPSRAALRGLLRVAAAAEPLFGGAVHRDGNVLDPELHAVLAAAQRAGLASIETLPVAQARARAARLLRAFDAAPRAMARIVDTHAPGPAGPLPVRVYVPHGAGAAMIVFFHGGGGVIGSVDSYDLTVRMLAARTGCVVASVDYRLAPEDPHPAAIEDAVAAWAWARAAAPRFGCDPARLAVAGDSFGGFLAAWVERRARDAGLGAPALTVLIYPLLDLTLTQPSIDTFADGFLLTRAMMTWFRGLYLPGDDAARRAASPLLLDDVRDAAPALIVTAGFDPLRDEGAAWAERLRATGARVTYRCHPELVHGFIGLTGGFRRADAATRALCDDVAAALGR